MRTTWFVISPHLAAVNQAQSTKIQLFGPGSLGLCAKEKKALSQVQNPNTYKKSQQLLLSMYLYLSLCVYEDFYKIEFLYALEP